MRVENLPYILFTADEGVIEMKFEIEISKGKLAILQLIGSIWGSECEHTDDYLCSVRVVVV